MHALHRIAQILRNLFRRGSNQNRQACAFSKRFPQRRVRAALVLAAQNHNQRPVEGLDRFERRIHIRGFRIVVEPHTRNFRHEFQPVFDPFESLHAESNRRRLRSRQIRSGARGQHIFNVVFASQRNLFAPGQRHFRALVAKENLIVAKEGPGRHALLAAEPKNVRLGRHAPRNFRIIRVQHGRIAIELIFEHAHLGARVLLE